MNKATALHHTFVLLSTPAQRANWGFTEEDAGRAVRAVRRLVARYGFEAYAGIMRQAQDDAERYTLERALSSARVNTIVNEWTDKRG